MVASGVFPGRFPRSSFSSAYLLQRKWNNHIREHSVNNGTRVLLLHGGRERERERKKKERRKGTRPPPPSAKAAAAAALVVCKKKSARERERERERKTSHRIDISNGISRFHKMYLVICPVVSNLFSLRSTYMAAVLYIPDPLLSRRSARKKNRRTLKGEF